MLIIIMSLLTALGEWIEVSLQKKKKTFAGVKDSLEATEIEYGKHWGDRWGRILFVLGLVRFPLRARDTWMDRSLHIWTFGAICSVWYDLVVLFVFGVTWRTNRKILRSSRFRPAGQTCSRANICCIVTISWCTSRMISQCSQAFSNAVSSSTYDMIWNGA